MFCFTFRIGMAQFIDASSKLPVVSEKSNRGVSAVDFDNDGDTDLFFVRTLAEDPNAFFVNNGDNTFTNRASEFGLEGMRKSYMAIWADFNEDGWLDLYITNYNAPNQLFISNEAKSFTEVSTNLSTVPRAGSINVADFDGDGHLDVFLNNLFNNTQLFINRGPLLYFDQALNAGLQVNKVGMGAIAFDIDKDFDIDLYMTFDVNENFWMMENDGSGVFANVTEDLSVGFKADGMGVDVGDYNSDGYFDIYLANRGPNALFGSQGQDQPYQDYSTSSQVDDNGMSWGISSFDYDNDGLVDIYVANDYGFVPFKNVLYHNLGNMTFEILNNDLVANKKNSFGTATLDYNNDGKMDLVVANRESIELFENVDDSNNNWLIINLIYTPENRFAVGARVEFEANEKRHLRQVIVGSGYSSQSGYELHFGLEKLTILPELTVYWPDGTSDTYMNIGTNERYIVSKEAGFLPFSSAKFAELLTKKEVPLENQNFSNANISREGDQWILSSYLNNKSFLIYNLSGAIVSKGTVSQNRIPIPKKEGELYFIKIFDRKQSYLFKVIETP